MHNFIADFFFCGTIQAMKLTQKTVFIIVVVVLVLGAISAVLLSSNKNNVPTGKYDQFATCLKAQGAVFYGAFWCPHCIATKKLFGSSASLLPYVECSTADGSGQLPVCADKKIEGYPTWEFKDGSRLTGEVSMQALADKTACPLPQ